MRPDHVCSNPFFVGATPSSRKASQTTHHRPGGGAPTNACIRPCRSDALVAKSSQTTHHRPGGGAPTNACIRPCRSDAPVAKSLADNNQSPQSQSSLTPRIAGRCARDKKFTSNFTGPGQQGFYLESQLGRHKDGPCHFLIKSDVLPGDWLAFVKTGSIKTVATVWPEASCPLGPSLLRHLPKKADSLIFVTARSPVDKVGGQLR